jgi:hypothetical protein
MRKRMYERGGCIVSLNELVHALEVDGYVYLSHKLQHASWVRSLQFNTLMGSIRRATISRAILTDHGRSVIAKRKAAEIAEELADVEKEFAA